MAAQRAVSDINGILKRMEVPLEVKENPKEGKHVIASAPLKAGDVLFQEVPIVSWPFSKFECKVDPREFCAHCLKRLTGRVDVRQSASNPGKPVYFASPEDEETRYCSPQCMKKNSNIHGVMSGEVQKKLRDFHFAEEEKKGDAIPISVEAIARCVATLFIRYLTARHQNPDANVSQLFEAASEVINRFVEPPKNSEFDDINAAKWYEFVRDTMKERLLSYFEDQTGAELEGNKQVVTALLSDETLKTILGQLTVNAQALNLIDPAPREEEEREDGGDDAEDAKEKEEEGEKSGKSNNNSNDNNDAAVYRISAGAGLYSIQSCFNHSCEPNAIVTFGDDHEIEVKVLKDTAAGEHVNITYISQLYLAFESVSQRRSRLSAYFFKCDCPKCAVEDAVAKGEKSLPPAEVKTNPGR